jgi:glycosyltransferase involved in cell wall biosynthesis
VTILIPTYNRASFLPTAIASVLSQGFTDLRLVVVDDASTDDTPEVVASFTDPRISRRRQPRNLGGWLGNSNSAFEGVDTEFVAWVGDDDEMLPGALSRAVSIMDACPSVGIVHTAFNTVDASGHLVAAGASMTHGLTSDTLESGEAYIRKSLLYGTRVCSPSALVRTSAVPPVPFDPEEGPTADAGLWLRIALNWDVYFLAEPGTNYRLHGGSDSAVWSRLAGDLYRPRIGLVRKAHWMKLRFIDKYHDQLRSPMSLRMIVYLATARRVVALAVPDSVAAWLRRGREGTTRRRP